MVLELDGFQSINVNEFESSSANQRVPALYVRGVLSLTVLSVVVKSQVVSDGVSQVRGQNVGLEHVNIHAYANGFARANRAHRRDCRATALERFAAAKKNLGIDVSFLRVLG